jgi:hypothetical protein
MRRTCATAVTCLALAALSSGCQPDSARQRSDAPTTAQREEERTRLLLSRGDDTALTQSGNRLIVDMAVVEAAFADNCSRSDLPAPCDDLANYRWSVAVESDDLVGMVFVHDNLTDTSYLPSFQCDLRRGERECYHGQP